MDNGHVRHLKLPKTVLTNKILSSLGTFWDGTEVCFSLQIDIVLLVVLHTSLRHLEVVHLLVIAEVIQVYGLCIARAVHMGPAVAVPPSG